MKPSNQAHKPVVSVRLNGRTLRSKWPGKRWHGQYQNIYEVSDAAHQDGLASFVIDYVDEEH